MTEKMETRQVSNSDIRSMYGQIIKSSYQNNYEFNRWFKSARLRLDYTMTYKSISHHLQGVNFSKCLELGPGPGTWTRLLYRKNPEATFDLVDISDSMRKQFFLEMRGIDRIKYHVKDFFEFESEKKYDLFFSSRAVEYIEDLDMLVNKISSLMSQSGTGLIVTKNPDHVSAGKFLGLHPVRKQHTGQISVEKMEALLHEKGLTDISFYPCIIRLPLLDRFFPALSERLHSSSYRVSCKKLSKFAESYIVTFSKRN